MGGGGHKTAEDAARLPVPVQRRPALTAGRNWFGDGTHVGAAMESGWQIDASPTARANQSGRLCQPPIDIIGKPRHF
jgi:hypothetical protein